MLHLTPSLIVSIFALINLWAFMLFGIDKLRAEAGAWRVSESTLLGWAFVGGSIGAYAGRWVFRHKTRKVPFVQTLHQIAAGQALVCAVGVGYWLG
jgi:uncharacterized membrane protein YsdA (DUF1294 family)